MRSSAFALIVAIFVVITFAVLGLVAVSLLSTEAIVAVRDMHGLQALNLAEAGIRYTIAASLAPVSNWSDVTGFTKTLAPGTFTVSYTLTQTRRVIMQVTGTVAGINRTVTATVRRGGYPGAFEYGIYAGFSQGVLEMQNNAVIYGDFFYNGPVTMKNNAALYNGTLYSASLTLQNNAYCASWEQAPPAEMPSFDASSYNFIIDSHVSVGASSSLKLEGSDVMDLNGGTYYYQGVEIQNNSTLIGPGTIVATGRDTGGNPSGTGKIIIKNNCIIGSDITYIATSDVEVDNNATMGANQKFYTNTNMLVKNKAIIPADSLIYSRRGNVKFDDAAQIYGAIIAPNGTMNMVDGYIQGLVYANYLNLEGTARFAGACVVYDIGFFKNNVVVTYDPSKLPPEVPEGFEGGGGTADGSGVSEWEEVY